MFERRLITSIRWHAAREGKGTQVLVGCRGSDTWSAKLRRNRGSKNAPDPTTGTHYELCLLQQRQSLKPLMLDIQIPHIVKRMQRSSRRIDPILPTVL